MMVHTKVASLFYLVLDVRFSVMPNKNEGTCGASFLALTPPTSAIPSTIPHFPHLGDPDTIFTLFNPFHPFSQVDWVMMTGHYIATGAFALQ